MAVLLLGGQHYPLLVGRFGFAYFAASGIKIRRMIVGGEVVLMVLQQGVKVIGNLLLVMLLVLQGKSIKIEGVLRLLFQKLQQLLDTVQIAHDSVFN